jgi:selenocysteine lyase/cysteine desulfurase
LVIISVEYDFEQGYIEPIARVVMARLGLEDSGGMVRVGPVHYNTVEEVRRFREALGKIAAAQR